MSIIKIASCAFDIFKSSKNGLRRDLLVMLFSNLSLKAEELHYSFEEPFHSAGCVLALLIVQLHWGHILFIVLVYAPACAPKYLRS